MKHEKEICKAFGGSKKVYIRGEIHDIKVGMREVTLTDTVENGVRRPNGSVRLYDTSGVYTDENVKVDWNQGVPRLSDTWGAVREGLGRLSEFTSS